MNENSKEDSPRFNISKVYLKDVSFESPQSPAVFAAENLAPTIDVQLQIDHQELDSESGFHEVVLTVTARASQEKHNIFLVEVQQGGVFQLQGVTGEDLSKALEISCPSILLPFAREAIAELVTKGGFPQLLINPVNFDALHQRNAEAKEETTKEEPTKEAPAGGETAGKKTAGKETTAQSAKVSKQAH